MRLGIGFEGKNGSQIKRIYTLEVMGVIKEDHSVHNWDLARSKMQEGSGKNVFEALQHSRSP
jgi:hypothetical protein